LLHEMYELQKRISRSNSRKDVQVTQISTVHFFGQKFPSRLDHGSAIPCEKVPVHPTVHTSLDARVSYWTFVLGWPLYLVTVGVHLPAIFVTECFQPPMISCEGKWS